MRTTVLCGIGLIAALAGCGPIQRAQIQERRAAVDVQAAACEQRLKSGEFKTHVAAASCINDAYARGISAGLYPYPDIRLAWGAARLRIAEQLDRHELSETEAKARLMEASAAATAEARHRNAENAQRNAEIDTMNAVSTGIYLNMIGQGIGMMQGR
jgi:hypothetical protein